MPAISQYLIMLVVGWASGISLYLTVAILGMSQRLGWYDLPGNLEILAHPLVIGTALILYAIEFLADKIPIVDNGWDAFHTWIRPAGAMAMGYLAGTEYGPAAETSLALLTGAIALDVHAVKATSRVAVNASPEPLSNITMSAAEDASVALMFILFFQHPWIAAAIVILTLIGSFFFLRMMWHLAKKLFGKKSHHEKANQ